MLKTLSTHSWLQLDLEPNPYSFMIIMVLKQHETSFIPILNITKYELWFNYNMGPNALKATKDCVDFTKILHLHDFENELNRF
jgi:hypothetical protein